MEDKKVKKAKEKTHLSGFPDGFRAGRRKKLYTKKLSCSVCGSEIKDFFFYYSYVMKTLYEGKKVAVYTTYSNVLSGQIDPNDPTDRSTPIEIACCKSCANIICLRTNYYRGDAHKNEAASHKHWMA